MKRFPIAALLCLLASAASAQTSLLPTLQRFRAEYPTPMSPSQLGEFLNRVAWEHRADGWGLLKKTAGSRCPAPQGVDVSCDILIHAPSTHHFDVLADSEGAAIPVWQDVGPCVLGPSSGCEMSRYLPPVRPAQARTTSSDLDGDGRSDPVLFRPSDGVWRATRSTAGPMTAPWGAAGDVPLVGDFDGDGRADLVVYRPSIGQWFILLSSNGFNPAGARAYAWGAAGDVPLIADYDGDGKSDLTVYRPSEGRWYIWFSRRGFQTGDWGAANWGRPTDRPVSADFDGDRRTDIVFFREETGEWFALLSSSGFTTAGSVTWGGAGDRPVPADFDGDGTTDVAVFRPSLGYWYIWYSAGAFPPSNRAIFQWGGAGDHPFPGDFDGDGKADLAVWRPSDAVWYVLLSSRGYTTWTLHQLGAPGDVPPRLP